MLTVFLKIAVIFGMTAIGFIANKKDVLPLESNQYLVNLLMVITTPCMIAGSMASKTLDDETLRASIEVIVGSLIFFIAVSFISLILVKMLHNKDKKDDGILMVIITSVNTGFMGFPVTKAIFGDQYLFLMVIENIVLTIYLYFIAVIQMNYGHQENNSLKEVLKPLCTLCTLASVIGLIILFGRIQLPEFVLDFLNTVGNATVPISMIVVGVQLGASNLREVFKNIRLIISSLENVILIPVLTYLAVFKLPITDEAKLILVFAAAFPCAVATVAVASKQNKNATLMAQGVALTTLFSMITVPFFAIFLMSAFC